MKHVLSMAVLGMFLLPALALAEPPPLAGPPLAGKKLMHEIGLSDQQIEKVQELSLKADREQIDIRADLDKAHLDMRQLLSADKPDQKAVFAQIEKIGALEIRMKKNRIGLMLEVRKLMTPAQWEKIEKIWAEEHGKGRYIHRGQGDEMRPSPPDPASAAAPTPADP
jgi:Spy/CpxP family protein refolding chaperone